MRIASVTYCSRQGARVLSSFLLSPMPPLSLPVVWCFFLVRCVSQIYGCGKSYLKTATWEFILFKNDDLLRRWMGCHFSTIHQPPPGINWVCHFTATAPFFCARPHSNWPWCRPWAHTENFTYTAILLPNAIHHSIVKRERKLLLQKAIRAALFLHVFHFAFHIDPARLSCEFFLNFWTKY
jgi:hypothetical protein